MPSRVRILRRAVAFVALLAPVLAGAAAAREAAPSSPPAPQPIVFVPYESAGDLAFGPERSVLLPYAEFLRLKGTDVPPGPDYAPTASLASTEYEGEVSGTVARLRASLAVEALARPDDELEIRLPFVGAAVESATVEGEGATFGPLDEGAGLRLLLRGPGRRTIRLVLVAPLSKAGPASRLALKAPRAAAAGLILRVPDAVELEEPPADAGVEVRASAATDADGATTIRAAFAPDSSIELRWRPAGEPASATSETKYAARIDASVAVSARTASMNLRVGVERLAGEISSVALSLPAGAELLGCTGSFVESWAVAESPDASGARVATVKLARPARESFDFEARLELTSPPSAAEDELPPLVVPAIDLPDAVRRAGTVVVAPEAGLSVWPEAAEGVEATSAPATAGPAESSRAFRFSRPGWRLELARRAVSPRLFASSHVLYEATEDLVRLKTRHFVNVLDRGAFGLTILVPPGYEVREAGPPETVAGFRRRGDAVEVAFRGERSGMTETTLRLQRDRAKDETSIALAPVAVEGAEEDSGFVSVATPGALRATELSANGLEDADVRATADAFVSLLSPDLEPRLAYRYFAPRFDATIAIERQRPRVACETSILASLRPSHVGIAARLDFEVEFSAADEFAVVVPAWTGEDVKIEGAGIKEKFRAETPADAEFTTWTVRLQSPALGAYALNVGFEKPLPEESDGEGVEVEIPKVRAAGVARETGHVAVSRGENLEVRVASSVGLEPRDAKELPPSLASAFLGFRYLDPLRHELKLELVRHELEDVLGALIRRMHVETVLSGRREATHEVSFEIQNNSEQYLELALPEGQEIWAAFVRGVPVRPTRRESDGARLIELVKSDAPGSAFRVRAILRETLPGGEMGLAGTLRFRPPEPRNLPIVRATWKLYLPEDFRYVAFDGSMDRERAGRPAFLEPVAEVLMNDLPAEFVGGPPKDLARPPQTFVGAEYDPAETPEERQARLRGSALEIPLVREGQQFQFAKLSGTGDIEVRFWKRKPLLAMQAIAAVLVFAGLLGAMRLRKRPWIGLAGAAATFAGASLAEGLASRLLLPAFVGAAGASALNLFLVAAAASTRAAKRVRTRADDPVFLDDDGRPTDPPKGSPPASPPAPEPIDATPPPFDPHAVPEPSERGVAPEDSAHGSPAAPPDASDEIPDAAIPVAETEERDASDEPATEPEPDEPAPEPESDAKRRRRRKPKRGTHEAADDPDERA